MKTAVRDMVLTGGWPALARSQGAAAAPTVDSGPVVYGGGSRLFTPAGANPATILWYPITAAGYNTGTVALRIRDNTAYDGAPDYKIYFAVMNATGDLYSLALWFQKSAVKWVGKTAQGGSTTNILSAAQSYAAGSVHTIVFRWSQGPTGTLDLNCDGVDSAQVANPRVMASGSRFYVGSRENEEGQPNGWVGPLLLSPVYKPQGWVDAIQAEGGEQYRCKRRLWRDFTDPADRLYPLDSDAVGYLKSTRSGLPFDLPGRVVCDGNSLTLGTNPVGQISYPAQLTDLLSADWVVSNLGVGSQTTQDMAADAADQIDPLIAGGYRHNVLVAWEIGNDIVIDGASVGEALEHFAAYCAARKAAGWWVIAVNVAARADVSPEDRATINASLAANWADYADALADVAAVLTDETNETYYHTDHIHLLTAGYAIVAGIVKDAVETLL